MRPSLFRPFRCNERTWGIGGGRDGKDISPSIFKREGGREEPMGRESDKIGAGGYPFFLSSSFTDWWVSPSSFTLFIAAAHKSTRGKSYERKKYVSRVYRSNTWEISQIECCSVGRYGSKKKEGGGKTNKRNL